MTAKIHLQQLVQGGAGTRITLVTSFLLASARIVSLHGGSMDPDMEEQEQE